MQCFLRLVVNVYCVLGEMCLVLADSLRCFVSLSYGPCRDLGMRAVAENQGGSGVGLLECCSPNREKNTTVPGH